MKTDFDDEIARRAQEIKDLQKKKEGLAIVAEKEEKLDTLLKEVDNLKNEIGALLAEYGLAKDPIGAKLGFFGAAFSAVSK